MARLHWKPGAERAPWWRLLGIGSGIVLLQLVLATKADSSTTTDENALPSLPRLDPLVAPSVSQGCPESCLSPACADGLRSNGGQIMKAGVCSYFCAPFLHQAGSVFSCGAGSEYEVSGSSDCRACDQGFSMSSSDSKSLANTLLDATFVKMDYKFDTTQFGIRRKGFGKLWLSLEAGQFKMRLEGKANSLKFGTGAITVVADLADKSIYAEFFLAQLHETQCLKYDFPTIADNPERVERILKRAETIVGLDERTKVFFGHANAFQRKWTRTKDIYLDLGDGGSLQKIEFKREGRTLKTILVNGDLVTEPKVPLADVKNFMKPPNCVRPQDAKIEIASLILQPPHGKSSDLVDLLLTAQMFASLDDFHSHRFLLILSAMAVPGDVAVMIEDPSPPQLGALGGFAFRYSSTITKQGLNLTSNGTIWMDVQERAFHLQGEAKETAIGPLLIDFVARGSCHEEPAKIYANFELPAQVEHQCISYNFPSLPDDVATALNASSVRGLEFLEIQQRNGEDCSVFVWRFTRERLLYIWVDMEAHANKAILRTEVRQNGKVLRSTDVIAWVPMTSDEADRDASKQVLPKADWHCTDRADGPLARLGITMAPMHQRSIELQDMLYSLDKLDSAFVVAQVFALTGDIAIRIEEPEVPDLRDKPVVQFNFSSMIASKARKGTFLADFVNRQFSVNLFATLSSDTDVFITMDRTQIVMRTLLGCLRIPLLEHFHQEDDIDISSAMFEKMEAVGQTECNRFNFAGMGPHHYDVTLWYDTENRGVTRLQVAPYDVDPLHDGVINITNWDQSRRAVTMDIEREEWACVTVTDENAWEKLGARAAAIDMEVLGIALSTVGILPSSARGAFARLATTPMVAEALLRDASVGPDATTATTTTTPTSGLAPVHVLSEGLRYFSFTFKSELPLHDLEPDGGPFFPTSAETKGAKHGFGEMKVDLSQRKFIVKSYGCNISKGIPSVDSTLIFRGDRQKLYARTKIKEQNFEKCWSMSTAEAMPPLAGGSQPNPFMRTVDSGSITKNIQGVSVRKYVLRLSISKHAQVFISLDGQSLVAITINDLESDSSVSVLVNDWSTDPISPGAFEVEADWACGQLENVKATELLAKSDLMQFLLPFVSEED